MGKLMDAPSWYAQNPGKTQQDYYKWMYQPQNYAQQMGATADELAQFDPNVSALDQKNAGANRALVDRKHAERQNDPRRGGQTFGGAGAAPAGFAGVSPGLRAPGGAMGVEAPSPVGARPGMGASGAAGVAPGLQPPMANAGGMGPAAKPGFQGVLPGSTDRIRQQQAARAAPGGLQTSMGRAAGRR